MSADDNAERIRAVRHMLASIFASQRALRELAPEFRWSGLGNLLGDFGELIAIDHYNLTKASAGSDGHDAFDEDGRSVQIKTNYAASQIGFRGLADLLLVVGVNDDGSWQEIYFGSFEPVLAQARYSARDNKHMIAISKLKQIKTQLTTPSGP